MMHVHMMLLILCGWCLSFYGFPIVILPVPPGGVSDGDCVGSVVVIVTVALLSTVSVSELTTVT